MVTQKSKMERHISITSNECQQTNTCLENTCCCSVGKQHHRAYDECSQ